MVLVICGAIYVYGLRAALGAETLSFGPVTLLRAAVLPSAILLLPVVLGLRHAVASIGAILALLLVLAFAPAPMLWLLDPLAAVVVLFGLWRLSTILVRIRVAHVAIVVILAVFAAALLAQINLRHNYALPIGFETALIGLAHQDTLFHAAVAQNLLNASVASIGADGLVPLVYHVFSHRVIAGLATWLGIEMLHAYGVFVSVVAIPVMLGLLLQVAAQIHQPGRIRLDPTAALLMIFGWLALGGALMWHSYYSSESYTLSLWLLLLAVPLLHRLPMTGAVAAERWVILALLALTVALAALTKVSVGAVLACTVAAGLVAEGRFRPKAWVLAALCGLLPALAVYLAYPVTQDGDAALFKPFAFLRYSRPAVYALLLAVILSVLAWRHFPRDHATRSLTLALGAGMWAGLGASYLVNTAAGAQYYFSDPGSWLGLLLIPLLGLVPKWLSRRQAVTQISIVAVFVALMLFLHDHKLRGLARVDVIEASLAALPEASTLGERAVRHSAAGQAVLAAQILGGEFDAIVVGGGHEVFWQTPQVCWASSFVLPAITGKPMVQGIIPVTYGCEISPYYGFADYDLSASRAPLDLSQDALCPVAQARGAARLLVVLQTGAELLACE
ncbi:MAG: hypothetical protein JJT99_11510 [Rhodobacteraceae bacterium]|nr:hypothetical protein [Paracoccaceae bacterium]